MSLSYVWEKFFAAVYTLATSPERLQVRLEYAYTGALIRLRLDDLPEELREEFAWVERELTKKEPVGGEGSVAATTRAMSDDTASKVAKTIVNLYDRIATKSYSKYPIPELHD